ncbi:phospho-acceptor domain-containing protein [Prosthecobacter fusiformis]|uniref:histidine kinase n=1 Tax=Prosthecobacter fusiformis TaxID=48464 RepID=A0A4R7SQF0_9BACT|nr:HAMP domain-containing sensor histidine kinase [Prosthecobacter fusiformis]TDU80865.1 phospho-acceptor domain-containing protein [Prosthecobacter fusiformis]
MRPFIRWFLFTLCLLVFTGAMGWISLRMLDMEDQRQRTAEDAQVQEKVRLALWRMDSLASTILIRENSRPAYHYQAFYAPDDLFASRSQSIPKGQALMPSPLFGSLPDLVQLHFEMMPAQGIVTSPQAPVGSQKELATSWYNQSPETTVSAQKLTTLAALLKKHPEVQTAPAMGAIQLLEIKPAAPMEKAKAAPEVSFKAPLDVQAAANTNEQNQRALVISNSIAQEKKEFQKPLLRKMAPSPPAKAEKAEPMVAADSTPNEEADDQKLDTVTRRYQSGGTVFSSSPSGASAVATPSIRQALPALAGDLQPLWVEKELLLVRNATVEGLPRLQGVWLDWPQLQSRLLETIRDLLPEATLIATSPQAARTDATALVTLPVKLLTGTVPVIALPNGSALKPALLVAWACLISAALAIAFVLHRAVLLSERRGAFVSAVTHELRTPLTTFRLYSEMLADDMVPDAAQRRTYLQTLCDESTRLMHLVENVLAYSRIERGRTAGRMETVGVKSLLDRIIPRLRQRTDQVDLELKLIADEQALASFLHADAMAIEQILFNLTDNACKYAAPDCDHRQLTLTVKSTGANLTFTLRDHGPGLPVAQKKRLFQPFSKSATEAAHSAPGVGLGLALSRRLARELGGDLIYQPPTGRGTAFQLTVRTASL